MMKSRIVLLISASAGWCIGDYLVAEVDSDTFMAIIAMATVLFIQWTQEKML